MAKATSKLQVTVPKAIAQRYGIQPGDDIRFEESGEVTRVVPADAADALPEAEELMAQFPIIYPDETVLRTALRAAAYGPSWFDAHLWAYAEVHGVTELLSEDFQHGRMYGTVTVRNPFLALSASA